MLETATLTQCALPIRWARDVIVERQASHAILQCYIEGWAEAGSG
jgi:hypothetical protein